MARTITLQNMLTELRWLADVEGATKRHTDQRLVGALNLSQQRFRQRVSECGHDYYLTTASGTISAGSESVAVPATLVALFGFEVLVNGAVRELFPYELSERNKYQSPSSDNTGIPTYYRLRSDTEIGFIPKADGSYSYSLLYLPTGTDFTGTFDGNGALTTSSSVFDGIAGWEDWLLYDTALRISRRDAGVNDNYELLKDGFAAIDSDVASQARKRNRSGPARRVDTRGRRMAIEDGNRWWRG